jgi:hypothetical protein
VSGGAGQTATTTPPLPQCWTQYGECLDRNTAQLYLTHVTAKEFRKMSIVECHYLQKDTILLLAKNEFHSEFFGVEVSY